MKPPRTLYKYQPFSSHSIENLEKHQIWFSKPMRLNDPYDCAIRLGVRPTSDKELVRLYMTFRQNLPDKEAMDAKYMTHGKPNSTLKTLVYQQVEHFYENYKQILTTQRGIACFSERNDHLLMWSHYAQGHTGFCLQFDTAFAPFTPPKIFDVQYKTTIPSVSPVAVLLQEVNALEPMLRTKADCWSYEREWRTFHKEGDRPFQYDVNCLTAVYFGINMDQDDRFRIMNTLKDRPTRFFQMVKKNDKFQLTSEEIPSLQE